MPLNSPRSEKNNDIAAGHLYVVATPIGNKDDITLRALDVLKAVDFVAAEDTRFTARLFALHNIKNQMISYHEHNEAHRTPNLIRRLQKGEAGALVSNAGTPTISDPGYDLIKACIENHIPVIPIPGVCAPATALSVSGLPTDAFVFMGFLAKKKQKRLDQISMLKPEKRTLIVYEAPSRVNMLLADVLDVLGDRNALLAREMTKVHEEFIRGRISYIIQTLKQKDDLKGECTLVISGAEDQPADMDLIRNEIKEIFEMTNISPSDVSKILAKRWKVSKKIIYDEVLKLKP